MPYLGPVIDTHVHLYDPQRFMFPWLSNMPQINKAHTSSMYLAASSNISLESFIFVEACSIDADSMEEVEWVTAIAESEPKLSGVVAQVAMERSGDARADLERLVANPLVKGVRRIFGEPFQSDRALSVRPEFIANVRSLPEFGFSFDVCGAPYTLEYSVRLVEACPDVTFVLDHIGTPAIASGELEPWLSHIKRLALAGNVNVKISGLMLEAGGPDIEKIRPFAQAVIEHFGFERIMYGSDYPVQEQAGGYDAAFNIASELVAEYSKAEQAQFFANNARRVYHLT